MFRADARLVILTAIGLWASTSASQAAWLGYKNETKSPVVVQTTMVVNNQVVRGKAHVLYPGEVAWDNIPAPGTRQLSIYDPKANNKLIHQDTVTIANQNIFLGVHSVVPPAQPGKAAPPPVIQLVVAKAPVQPGVAVTNPNANPGAAQQPGKGTPPNQQGNPSTGKPGTPTPPNQPGKPNQPAPGKPSEQPKPNTPPKKEATPSK